jgi:hypothetical protein
MDFNQLFNPLQSNNLQENEDILLGNRIGEVSQWKRKKFEIENRQKGWIHRFAKKIDNYEVLDPPKSRHQTRIDRMRETG